MKYTKFLFFALAIFFASCDKEEPQFSPEEDLTLWDAGPGNTESVGISQSERIEAFKKSQEFLEAEKAGSEVYEKDGIFYSSYGQYQKITENGKRSANHFIRLTTQSGQTAPQADMFGVQVKSGGSYQHISWLQTTTMTIGLPWAGANLCGGMVQLRNATFPWEDSCAPIHMEYYVNGTRYFNSWENGYGDFSGSWKYNYYKSKNGVISGIQILTGNCDGSWEEC